LDLPQYKRVVLKLSGEALMGDQSFGISGDMIKYVAEEVRSVFDLGIQLSLVIGGGNIFRGIAASSYDLNRVSGDHMGMLATVINSLALQDALEKKGIQTRVQTAISIHEIAEPFIVRRAIRHLEKGRVVIFAAGNAHRKSMLKSLLKPQKSMDFTIRIQKRIKPQKRYRRQLIWKCFQNNLM